MVIKKRPQFFLNRFFQKIVAFPQYRNFTKHCVYLQLGGKLDPKAGNGHQKKAGGGVGAGASATVEEPETELCGGKDMRLVKGKSMPSLR